MERSLHWSGAYLPDNYPGRAIFCATERAVQLACYIVVGAVVCGIAVGNLAGTIAAGLVLLFLLRYPVRVVREPSTKGDYGEYGHLIAFSCRRDIDNYDRSEFLRAIDEKWDYGSEIYRNTFGDIYFKNPRLQELLAEQQIPIRMHPLELLMGLTGKANKPIA